MKKLKGIGEDSLKSPRVPMGIKLHLLAKTYYALLSQHLKEVEPDRYFYILSIICSHEKITQQCLANLLDLDKALVARIMSYLCELKLVKRIPNPEDKRAHLIIPTQKAQALLPELEAAFKLTNKQALKGFSREEQTQFYQFIERITQNLTHYKTLDGYE